MQVHLAPPRRARRALPGAARLGAEGRGRAGRPGLRRLRRAAADAGQRRSVASRSPRPIEHDAGEAVEPGLDARAREQAAGLRGHHGEGDQPGERDHREERAQHEERDEHRLPGLDELRQQAREERGDLRVREVVDQPLAEPARDVEPAATRAPARPRGRGDRPTRSAWMPSQIRYAAPAIFMTVNAVADACTIAATPNAAASVQTEQAADDAEGRRDRRPAPVHQGVLRDERGVGPGRHDHDRRDAEECREMQPHGGRFSQVRGRPSGTRRVCHLAATAVCPSLRGGTTGIRSIPGAERRKERSLDGRRSHAPREQTQDDPVILPAGGDPDPRGPRGATAASGRRRRGRRGARGASARACSRTARSSRRATASSSARACATGCRGSSSGCWLAHPDRRLRDVVLHAIRHEARAGRRRPAGSTMPSRGSRPTASRWRSPGSRTPSRRASSSGRTRPRTPTRIRARACACWSRTGRAPRPFRTRSVSAQSEARSQLVNAGFTVTTAQVFSDQPAGDRRRAGSGRRREGRARDEGAPERLQGQRRGGCPERGRRHASTTPSRTSTPRASSPR